MISTHRIVNPLHVTPPFPDPNTNRLFNPTISLAFHTQAGVPLPTDPRQLSADHSKLPPRVMYQHALGMHSPPHGLIPRLNPLDLLVVVPVPVPTALRIPTPMPTPTPLRPPPRPRSRPPPIPPTGREQADVVVEARVPRFGGRQGGGELGATRLLGVVLPLAHAGEEGAACARHVRGEVVERLSDSRAV